VIRHGTSRDCRTAALDCPRTFSMIARMAARGPIQSVAVVRPTTGRRVRAVFRRACVSARQIAWDGPVDGSNVADAAGPEYLTASSALNV
jgi:hypothetical protein